MFKNFKIFLINLFLIFQNKDKVLLCSESIKSKLMTADYKKETLQQNILKCYNYTPYKNNFNYSYNPKFPNLNSDILLYLSMWQYWWWFWFSFLLVFYYILIFSIFSKRQKYFNPRINTSLKSHGKWGDLIVGLIPIYWCLNILLNSNTLLKILEWQTESNILTLRIRGKQWYWIYKIDIQNVLFKNNINRYVGHNYIVSNNFKKNENTVFLKYLQNIYNLKYFKKHKDFLQQKKSHKIRNLNLSLANQNYLAIKLNKNIFFKTTFFYKNYPMSCQFRNKQLLKATIIKLGKNISITKNTKKSSSFKFDLSTIFYKKIKKNIFFFKSTKKFLTRYKLVNNTFNINFFEKLFSKQHSYSKVNNFFFKSFEINSNFKNKLKKKNSIFSFFKGQIYVKFWKNTYKKYPFDAVITLKNERLLYLNKNKTLLKNYFNNFEKFIYNYKKHNHSYLDLNSRLLKSKEILVLPANVNMTIITNSFDVVHSWFVPGLGIKMDCVPGRSTHHSFCFDINGIFYGQCAEICGRFHHHMPIKVAIIYYESFMLWYNHVALKKIFKNKNKKLIK